jgi:hypothetical protein
MGRDTYRYRALDKEREERQRLNPIWRGIGCITLSIFGAAGYFFAQWFLRANAVNGWLYLPPGAYNPDFPNWLSSIEPYLQGGVLIKLVVALLFVVVSFGVLNFFYAIGFPIRTQVPDTPPPDKRLARRQRREERRAAKERRRFRRK